MPTKEQYNRYYRNWVENNPNAKESIRGQNQRSYARRKKKWFSLMAQLKDCPCVDCGQKFHPAAMQFDHINGDKEYTVSGMMNAPIERVMAEIEKCVVRCANCHAIRHYGYAYEVTS